MLKSVRSKVLALIAALGLGAGVVVTFTSDGCTVKPAQPLVVDAQPDAGVVEVVPVEDAGVVAPVQSDDAGSPDAGQ